MPTDLTVVLDTNVWISGIFFRNGVPAKILAAWQDQKFEVAFSTETLDELATKLQLKTTQFGANLSLAEEWIEFIQTFSHQVNIFGEVSGVCRDPEDDKLLEVAARAGAQYLVSGDKDLQVVGAYREVKIITPRQFIELIEK